MRNAKSVCRRLDGKTIWTAPRVDGADVGSCSESGDAGFGSRRRRAGGHLDLSGHAVDNCVGGACWVYVCFLPSILYSTLPTYSIHSFRFHSIRFVEENWQLTFPSLVINIIAGEVVEPLRRTAVFGMLQGCIMLGQGVGYLS